MADTLESEKVDAKVNVETDSVEPKDTNGGTEIKKIDTVKTMPKKTAPPIPTQKKMFGYDRYATVKSAGLGLLVITLIVDASVRLRKVVDLGADEKWYLPMLILISILLGLLAIEGILLVYLSTQNLQNPRKQRCLQRINIVSTILAGLITIISVIVLNIMADSGLYVGVPNPRSNGTNYLATTPGE
uniref:Uncharacterized protein n=1 Tax=Ciona savignyi TaxID=51511 RepID=H2ZJK3_CIOSA